MNQKAGKPKHREEKIPREWKEKWSISREKTTLAHNPGKGNDRNHI